MDMRTLLDTLSSLELLRERDDRDLNVSVHRCLLNAVYSLEELYDLVRRQGNAQADHDGANHPEVDHRVSQVGQALAVVKRLSMTIDGAGR